MGIIPYLEFYWPNDRKSLSRNPQLLKGMIWLLPCTIQSTIKLSLSLAVNHYKIIMNCHFARLAYLGILVLITLKRADCSENHCDTSDNPEKCKPTVRNHLLNTIRTLWSDELLPEQTSSLTGLIKEEFKGLAEKVSGLERSIASKDTEIAQLKEQLNVSHNLHYLDMICVIYFSHRRFLWNFFFCGISLKPI